MFIIPFGLLFRLALWLLGCYFLWRFGKDLPERFQEIADSRQRLQDAIKNPKQDAEKLREEHRGDVLAFAIICGLVGLVALYVVAAGISFLRYLGVF